MANQPRILQISISPPGVTVSIEGILSWKRNNQNTFEEIGHFKSKPFVSRVFYNDEIGKGDIQIESSSYDSHLMEENINKGKPSGEYQVTFIVYNSNGNQSGQNSVDYTFLNPTPPIIQLPIEGASYDIGSIPVQWTESQGASSYKITANYIEEGQSPEEALNSSNPLINNRQVFTTSVDFRDLLDRELLTGKDVVIVVKAVVEGTAGETELPSPIVTFKTNAVGTSGGTEGGTAVDPNILKLADLLKGKVSQVFINQLKNGEVPVDQIQITDEGGNEVSFNDLLSLLTYLDSNSGSLISINFTAQ